MGGTTGMNYPPTYAACQHGFDIMNGGPAETFYNCLAKVDVNPFKACDPKNVQVCIDETFKSACEITAVRDYCKQVNDACVAANDMTFNVDACAYQLSPFKQDTINAYADCFNMMSNLTCSDAHDACWAAQF